MYTNIIKESYRGFDSIEISDEMFSKRVITFFEDVSSESMERLISQLLILDEDAPGKPITILINSPGGNVNSGLACVDIIAGLTSPLRTVVTGIAASMGAILFLMGKERIITPRSKILIHDPSYSSGIQGKPLDLEEAVNDLMNTRKELAEIIADVTKHTIEEVYEKTRRDYVMAAKEALEWGAATAVKSFTIADSEKEINS